MFDALCLSNWYVWQGVSWHDLACLVQRMLLVTHCNAFVIWACVVAATMAFDFHSGGLLPCLMPVSLYIFDRWYPDMIWHVCCGMFWHVSFCQVVYWHVLANGCVLFTWTLLTGAILSSRQDTTRACKNREKKHAGLAGFSDNPYLTTPTQHVMVGITRSKVIFSNFRISMGFQTFFFSEKNPTEFPMSSAWSALTWSYCHIAPHLQPLRTTSLQRKNFSTQNLAGELTFSQFETRVKTITKLAKCKLHICFFSS